ncbi:hypothetical protein HL658_09865 [Azospirillum sp. RWY-5-1]|uniref:Uncharacterized protein n=1 Tax=Azospirillum oleiclasticum TaxID=2735135 RepID=A0ABX2T9Z3_9PROT|nr:hypothetical protein [Azospirillum oleiclasticum]NYZ12858.1 hypothetical protein [Azospirillum oleiclasticum]NYZ20018.1 hypothetical protein [Azospirillum oleiclasticum]
MTRRLIPQVGLTVEIAVDGGGVVTRRVQTVRDHGDGRYTCVIVPPDGGGIETVTIAPAGGHWVCVAAPVDVLAAVHLADRVLRGDVLHGSATAPLLALARAVLHMAGPNRPAPACGPAATVTVPPAWGAP